MTKLATAMVLALAADALFAVDSYIYWMVDSSVSSSYSYDYATIKVSGSDSYLHMYDPGEDMLLDGPAGTKLAAGESGYFGAFDASSMGAASFLIELWAGSEANSIASAILVYSTAKTGDSIYTPGAAGGATPYSVSGFAAVPEPTSGLLLLIGMAGLALRRKSRC